MISTPAYPLVGQRLRMGNNLALRKLPMYLEIISSARPLRSLLPKIFQQPRQAGPSDDRAERAAHDGVQNSSLISNIFDNARMGVNVVTDTKVRQIRRL